MEKRNTTAAIIKEVFIVAIAIIALLAALIIVLRSVGPAILGYKLQNVVWDYSEDPETVMVCYAGDADETVRRPTVSVIMPPEGQRTFMAILKQSGGRFIRKGLPGEAGSLQIVMRFGEHVSFFTLAEDGTLAVGGENGDNRIYHLDENTTHRVSSVCHTYTGPNSHYPGLTFLQEFFAIDKDDRAAYVWLDAPDGVYGGGAVETLHSGIESYMTEHGFNKVLMDRSLYRLEYICKQKGSDWTCSSIEVAPASEPGYYTYRVSLVEYTSGSSRNLVFTGNYYVGEDGLVDNFYVDLNTLPGDISSIEDMSSSFSQQEYDAYVNEMKTQYLNTVDGGVSEGVVSYSQGYPILNCGDPYKRTYFLFIDGVCKGQLTASYVKGECASSFVYKDMPEVTAMYEDNTAFNLITTGQSLYAYYEGGSTLVQGEIEQTMADQVLFQELVETHHDELQAIRLE